MKQKDYREEIKIPEGVSAQFESSLLVVTKGKETVKRHFRDPKIIVTIMEKTIVLQTPLLTKKEKKIIGSFASHIKNMLKGVQEPFVYTLKVCSGHFPINLSVSGNEFIVKNFVGEKIPRVLKIQEGVTVKVEGETVTVTSADVERAGHTAGAIELLCKRPGFDKRVFQQGIYITEKAGVPV